MSLINQYRSTENAIKELQQRLQSLEADDRLKQELEFEQKLRALMAEYNKSERDVIEVLDPNAGKSRAVPASTGKRAARAMKVFKNPHTGEVVETKGGNHKVLKAWKEQWGAEAVNSWLQ